MNKNNSIVAFVIVIAVLVVGGFLIVNNQKGVNVSQSITNFDECAKAGYPVMESYPRQCRVPGGQLFVEKIANTNSPTTPVTKGGCFIGGCSAQICSDQKDAVSTCEYREKYGCYKTATCERQANGQCGWTPTTKLSECLDAYSH